MKTVDRILRRIRLFDMFVVRLLVSSLILGFLGCSINNVNAEIRIEAAADGGERAGVDYIEIHAALAN